MLCKLPFAFFVVASLNTGLLFSDVNTLVRPDKFVVYSPPKCGTHLVGKLLGLMFDLKPEYHLEELGNLQECLHRCRHATNNGAFVVAHAFNCESLSALIREGYKVIFILRDPRDQLVSAANWLREGQWQFLGASKIANDDELITELITGKRFGWRCFEDCIGSRLVVVRKCPVNKSYITRFEALVGPEGGGDDSQQLHEIFRIASFLGVELPYERAEYAAYEVFGDTWSFRRGQIGAWRERFTLEQLRTYKRLYGKWLVQLGYESNYSW